MAEVLAGLKLSENHGGSAPVVASRLGACGGDIAPGLASGATVCRRYRD
ncbi:hypothetical protein SH528x_006518 [Novipirellula sp. SH528]